MANATATEVLRMGQFTPIETLIGPLLREEELNLDPQLPGRRLAWADDVVERLELRVHRQRAELAQILPARKIPQPEQLAPARAQGHGPLVPAARHPVGRQGWARSRDTSPRRSCSSRTAGGAARSPGWGPSRRRTTGC